MVSDKSIAPDNSKKRQTKADRRLKISSQVKGGGGGEGGEELGKNLWV